MTTTEIRAIEDELQTGIIPVLNVPGLYRTYDNIFFSIFQLSDGQTYIEFAELDRAVRLDKAPRFFDLLRRR
jgi:hypothetical protein